MARGKGIKNRGTQVHEDKREKLIAEELARQVEEEIDLEELAVKALLADMRRADAFALAVAGRKG